MYSRSRTKIWIVRALDFQTGIKNLTSRCLLYSLPLRMVESLSYCLGPGMSRKYSCKSLAEEGLDRSQKTGKPKKRRGGECINAGPSVRLSLQEKNSKERKPPKTLRSRPFANDKGRRSFPEKRDQKRKLSEKSDIRRAAGAITTCRRHESRRGLPAFSEGKTQRGKEPETLAGYVIKSPPINRNVRRPTDK